MSDPTTIRFNDREEADIKFMGEFLGISSRSAIVKASIPWARQRVNIFLKEFEQVIQPLKYSEIDALISTMKIRAKQVIRQKKQENGA